MSALNRYGIKGRFVEEYLDNDNDNRVIVLWDAAPDGTNSGCWVDIRTNENNRLIDTLHGSNGWSLAEAREVALAQLKL